MNIENIQKILLECYSKDLCYPKVQDDWDDNNKCFGMCAITSLIINDYFSGDICKIYVDEISHYFNLIDNKIIDLTSSQFNHEVNYKDYTKINSMKDKLLEKFTPFALEVDTFGLYEIYPAKLVKQFKQFINDLDYEKISPTAVVTSYPRIFTDIPYEKEIYNWLEHHCNEEVTLNKMLAPEIVARYKLTNKLLDKYRIKQVLELAAGYSSRGLFYSKKGYNYVELDLENVTKNKKEILHSIEKDIP